ncbi:hypothetical protein SEPCBS119000_001042 [Sporothrix epigloea]|uniref:Uncharacterized protein n=1 Tax=Sporothrix epigloea TaxID=1892477 RepID=A0ABP0DBP1_9PEZI
MPPSNRRDRFVTAEGSAYASYTPAASRLNTGIQSPAARRYEESWVEIDSQPSSSSLSSIADEIVITGLRVGSSATGINGGAMPNLAATNSTTPQRRRRLLQQVEAAATATVNQPATPHSTSLAAAAKEASIPLDDAIHSSAGSSQEEYDETESEEDHVMASSTENMAGSVAVPRTSPSYSLQHQATQGRLQQMAAASDGDDEGDVSDDDEGTALGMPSSAAVTGPHTFRPQPNAFSHPPTHLQHHHQQHHNHQSHHSLPTPHSQVAGSPYVPRCSRMPSRHYSTPSFMSPSYRENNDAALRASLTTLLSCAAAARGLPKKDGNGSRDFVGEQVDPSLSTAAAGRGVRPSNQPVGLQLVSESELMDDDHGNHELNAPVSPHTRAPFQPPRIQQQSSAAQTASYMNNPKQTASSSSNTKQQQHSSRDSAVSAISTSSKSKRTGANKTSPRVTKKKRTSITTADNGVTMISPTLLTWVVSAGVVVLVSVVGFGAGFVIGREVGRQEAASSVSAAAGMASGTTTPAMNGSASSCGREILRSSTGSTLRRFRWGAGMTNNVAA